MEEIKKNNRIEYLDTAKGFVLAVIVYAHTFNMVYGNIYTSFIVPIFFIISGYLFNSKKYENDFFLFFKAKFKSLVIPYWVTLFIFFVMFYFKDAQIIFPGDSGSNPLFIFGMFLKSAVFSMGNDDISGHFSGIMRISSLWFITCLFAAEILFYWLFKSFRKFSLPVQCILYSLFSYAGILAGYYIYLPWSLDLAMYSVIFLFAGYCIRQYNLFEKMFNSKYRYWIFLLVVLIIVLLTPISCIDMNCRVYHNVIFGNIAVTAITVAICFLCNEIQKIQFKIVVLFRKIFSYIGTKSLIVYLFHEKIIELNVLPVIDFGNFVFVFYVIGIALLLGLIIKKIPILNKVYYPYLNK